MLRRDLGASGTHRTAPQTRASRTASKNGPPAGPATVAFVAKRQIWAANLWRPKAGLFPRPGVSPIRRADRT